MSSTQRDEVRERVRELRPLDSRDDVMNAESVRPAAEHASVPVSHPALELLLASTSSSGERKGVRGAYAVSVACGARRDSPLDQLGGYSPRSETSSAGDGGTPLQTTATAKVTPLSPPALQNASNVAPVRLGSEASCSTLLGHAAVSAKAARATATVLLNVRQTVPDFGPSSPSSELRSALTARADPRAQRATSVLAADEELDGLLRLGAYDGEGEHEPSLRPG